MKLELYYAPKTCALVPYVTLTEAGAEFTVHNLNSRSGQLKTPGFLRLNPKHKVPVLIIDGEPLTENIAIQIWIARRFPQAQLLPQDPRAEIQAISVMAWLCSSVHPHLTPNARPENYCDLPGSAEAVKRAGNKLLFEDFTLADRMLAGREFFFDRFTAPDAYFFSGPSVAPLHSSSTCRHSPTAWRISNACSCGPACGRYSPTKNRSQRILPARPEFPQKQPWPLH